MRYERVVTITGQRIAARIRRRRRAATRLIPTPSRRKRTNINILFTVAARSLPRLSRVRAQYIKPYPVDMFSMKYDVQ